MTITIPASELLSARDLAVFIRHDETDARGKICLRGDGQRRWWFATSDFFGGRIAGGVDKRKFELLIPQSVLWSLEALTEPDGDITIKFNEEGGVWAVKGSLGDVWFHRDDSEFPEMGEYMDDDREELWSSPRITDGVGVV